MGRSAGLGCAAYRRPSTPCCIFWSNHISLAPAALLLPCPLQLDPGNVHALFNRGISHEKRGDQRAAIADFSACISLDPGNAVAYYNRAACYDAVGEFDKASGQAAAVLIMLRMVGHADGSLTASHCRLNAPGSALDPCTEVHCCCLPSPAGGGGLPAGAGCREVSSK